MDGLKFMEIMFGLLILYTVKSGLSQTIHEGLTPEEQGELFPMAGSEIPEYEIMPIHHSRIRKSANNRISMRMNAFGKNIKLWLNPIDSILATAETPVFTYHNGSLIYYPGEMAAAVRKMYQDLSQAATISIDEIPGGRVELNGIVGTERIQIRPVPLKHENEVRRRRRSIDNIPESEIDNYTYHIAYKIPETPDFFKTLEKPIINSIKAKRSAHIIYPEMLVVVHHSLYKRLNFDFYTTLLYLVAFWNAVDLRYRTFENPRIRLNIAAVIIGPEPNSLEYTQVYEGKEINSYLLLDRSKKWLYKRQEELQPYYNFDIAVTMVSDQLCFGENYQCTKHINGLAYTSHACHDVVWGLPNMYTHETLKSAVVLDDSGFQGISTGAHELAHLFGVKHDGDNNNCKDGHIMAPSGSGYRQFSSCSLKQMEKFLNSDRAACLYNLPRGKGKVVPRFLPGKLIPAEEQCRRFQNLPLAESEDICKLLWCQTPEGGKVGTVGAADGTNCTTKAGEEKICLNGKCISEASIYHG